MTSNIYDIVIVGSGPAGIMSIIKLQNKGLKIAFIDDNSSLGGQIYKNIEKNAKYESVFGKEYLVGLKYIKKVNLDEVDYINDATVWSISPNKEIYYSKEGNSTKIEAKKIILATGSMERPFPIKGWSLPGVMGATAAQIVLKDSMLFKDDAVFVGTGPLFYYVIAQYLDAGAKIKAIVDTTPMKNYFTSLKYLPRALLNIVPLLRGLSFFFKFKKYGVKVYNFVENVALEGDEELQRVVINNKTSIDTRYAFIHNGLAPNINLQLEAGCDYEFSHNTRTITIKTDSFMESSVKDIYVIGDGKAIRGVDVAISEAKIATLKILKDLKKIDDVSFKTKYASYLKTLNSNMNIRAFLDALYLPNKNFIAPIDENVIVCRCEEITLKNIKDGLEVSSKDLNSIKGFTRAGMGNCQARLCALTQLEIVSRETNTPIEELSFLRARSPIKPIRIEEMARLK